MNPTETPNPAVFAPSPASSKVVRVQTLTPHMVRIVFAGEELEGFTTPGPGVISS